jgi:hypothetical protein
MIKTEPVLGVHKVMDVLVNVLSDLDMLEKSLQTTVSHCTVLSVGTKHTASLGSEDRTLYPCVPMYRLTKHLVD